MEEWREYYFSNVRSKDQIIELGKKLYMKMTEVISAEVEEITEKGCINYMLQFVIDRAFKGYWTEMKTIYGQLEQELGYEIESASDEWDRLFNVDFFIKIKVHRIPDKVLSSRHSSAPSFQRKRFQDITYEEFEAKYDSRFFYIYSFTSNRKK